MPRSDEKLWFYAEPPLSYVLGKKTWLATALLLLTSALLWRLADLRWAVVFGVPGLVGVALASWRRYQFAARHPAEGELDAEGRPHGPWVWRFPGGAVGRVAQYEHGVLHGDDCWYYPDGKKYQQARMEHGELTGPVKQWDRDE